LLFTAKQESQITFLDMIMVMGTEGFSNAGNNNCDRTRTRERKRKRAREERESVAEKGIPEVLELWRRSLETTDGRTDERTEATERSTASLVSLVHFFISLVSFSSIAKPKST